MGRLDKYARKQKKEPRNQSVSTKLTTKEYMRFVDYLAERNLDKSEALYLLILEEIGITREDKHLHQDENAGDINENESKPIASKRNDTQVKKEPRRLSEGVQQWKINKKLPCPICKEWSGANNFAKRHARKHGYSTTYEFLKTHEDEVKAMLEKEKGDDIISNQKL